ncbi:hypothetical protein [Vibrio hepatarius]|uniref:hypothetical protein n=1 Tax=Vibrio hepatarius TaxID=171383 RepID=UPI00142E370D|nr:hypothetical protein [Vibrio hepatarius]NIY83694.1 hypothetical protein [Vibrio hepatarius]
MVIGYNPNTNKFFGKLHAGVGVGLGWGYDPLDTGNANKQRPCADSRWSMGSEVNWGINYGQIGIGANSKTNFGDGLKGNPNDLLNPKIQFDGLSESKKWGGSIDAGLYIELN